MKWRLVALVVLALATSACGSGAAVPKGPATAVRVVVTPQGCRPDPDRVPAGTIEVTATNLNAPTVSEVEVRTENLSTVLGEKEFLLEGVTARFSAGLSPGSYLVNCPGAAQAHWPLVATPRGKR